MDGFRDGWMGGFNVRTNAGLIDEWMDAWMDAWIDWWMCRCVCIVGPTQHDAGYITWVHVLIGGWVDGCID